MIKKAKSFLKKIVVILFIVSALVAAGILFVIFKILGDDGKTAPVYFSLDNPNAHYTIHKYEAAGEASNYMVFYSDSKDTVEVEVGNSKVALDPYVNKKIIINGSYSGRIGKQCIVNRCTPDEVGSVIDIDSIQVVK